MSKSENKGKVPTEMELVLEQTQQEHQSDTQVITVKMEILLEPTSNKLMIGIGYQQKDKNKAKIRQNRARDCKEKPKPNSILQAGNPVKEILLKLNLPDHRILKDGGEEVLKLKNFKKDALLKLFKLSNQERYENVGPKVTSSQDGEVYKMAKRDYAWLMISRCLRSHIHTQVKLKEQAQA
ncbi:hypothetical protein Tco_0640521 [Tanacetum coccineum]